MILSQRRSPVEDIFKISFTLSAIKERFCGYLTLDDGKKIMKRASASRQEFSSIGFLLNLCHWNKQVRGNKQKTHTNKYTGPIILKCRYSLSLLLNNVNQNNLLTNTPLTEDCFLFVCLMCFFFLNLLWCPPFLSPGSWGRDKSWETSPLFLR